METTHEELIAWGKRMVGDIELEKLAIEMGVLVAAGGGDRDRTDLRRVSEILMLAAYRGYELAAADKK